MMSNSIGVSSGGDAFDLSELQALAHSYLSRQESRLTRTELKVGAVLGDELPWRIVERIRLPSGQLAPTRRRLSFASRDTLRQYLIEQINWRDADAHFLETHMRTPDELAGITTDYVPRRLFDAVFEGPREIVRAKLCRTQADHILEWTPRSCPHYPPTNDG